MSTMEEKYGKVSETFREKVKHEIIPLTMKNSRIECLSQILEKYKRYYENLHLGRPRL